MNLLREVYNEIVAQATSELPDESCGYLLADGENVVENYRMTNADHSPEHFSFVPKEQFEAVRYARRKGLRVVANWHSHPSSPSRPSEEDIRLAYDSSIDYYILSLATNEPVLNRFHIVDGSVEKLSFTIKNQ
jgi:proteasome lid subunit RPN8/RPN11